MGIMDKNLSRNYFADEKSGKKAKPDDPLAQDAAEAAARGLSYGQYKGLQYEAAMKKTPPAPAPQKEQTDPRAKYDFVCCICGQEFKAISKYRKYCGPSCAEKANRIAARKRKAEQRNASSQ